MSLKHSRQIANRARKSGRRVVIVQDSVRCDRHSPTRHRMSGNYCVIDRASGEYLWK